MRPWKSRGGEYAKLFKLWLITIGYELVIDYQAINFGIYPYIISLLSPRIITPNLNTWSNEEQVRSQFEVTIFIKLKIVLSILLNII